MNRLGTMFRIVYETLQTSEVINRLKAMTRFINEGINIAEDKLQRVFGSVVDGGKTVGTHDTTITTRGSDVSKTVKTYKTDETIR